MKQLFFVFLVLITVVSLRAQSYVNSPYSRYGLGEMQTNTEPVSFAMGGLSAAFRDRFSINAYNPASYTAFTKDTTYPMVFNGGFKGNFSHQQTLDKNAYPFTMSLNSFSLGFRLDNNWGMALGLQPYSSVGYLMQSEQTLDSISNYTAIYEGSGGYNKFWMGHSFRFFNRLSVGLNASYIFGSINQTRRVVFDTSIYFNTKTVSSRYVGDFAFDAGVQYEMILKRDTSLAAKHTRMVIGGTVSIPSKLNASQSQMAFRYYTLNGVEILMDTVGQESDLSGYIRNPLSYSGGFITTIERHGEKKHGSNEGQKKTAKWSFGADFKVQNWSGFTSFGQSDSLKNSLGINAGFSLTPDNSSLSKYFQKMTYYGGLHYEQTYLSLKGQQLTKVGISFGCTFPLKSAQVRQQIAVISTGFELGKMGTTDQNLIEENYIRFVLGISFKERWFEKRKYN